MAQPSSNYECAVEIREAISSLPDLVADALRRVGLVPSTWTDRRAEWAGRIFVELISRDPHDLAYGWPTDDRYTQLAAVAWRLADQLDASDPRRTIPRRGAE